MREYESEIAALGAHVSVVSFEPPERATLFADRESLPFPLLLDPTRRAYAAFGLQEAAPTQLWNWNSLTAYVQGILRGRAIRLPQTNFTQLGGDFVVDSANRIVFAHRSAEPADRPAISDILAALRAAASDYPSS